MNMTRVIPGFFLLFFILGSPLVLADSRTAEMADIILHLNHHPSGAEKRTLREILNSDHASKGERILAMALLNMNHKVTPADRAQLRELAQDSAAPAAERELAEILMNLNHKPSASAKERLKRLR